MNLITWPTELWRVFERYADTGERGYSLMNSFLVQYVFFELEQNKIEDYTLANRTALQKIAEHEGYRFVDESQPVDPSTFSVTYKPSLSTPHVISPAQFLGPMYDFDTRRLIAAGDQNKNMLFYANEINETKQNAINPQILNRELTAGLDLYSNYIAAGYAAAFSDPVHGLGLSKKQLHDFFNEVNTILFNDFKDDLEIMQWPTDWSSYFDAGHEWWGAYWWTVHNRTKKQLIIVAASGTD